MKNKFDLTKYHIKSDFSQSMRLALVTDMHEYKSEILVNMLEEIKPDLILIAGDTFERYDEGEDPCGEEDKRIFQKFIHKSALAVNKAIDTFKRNNKERISYNVYDFFQKAEKIAPVYLSRGNHEWYFRGKDYEMMRKYHITLLDNEDTEVFVKGQKIRIGGLSTKYDLAWLTKYSEKDGYKVLLNHHPEYYEKFYQQMIKFNLILSGHVHGGQWRIGNRGVFAPGQGLFPKYSHGVYEGRLVVSSGCSNTAAVPRFNNPCELVVLEIGK